MLNSVSHFTFYKVCSSMVRVVYTVCCFLRAEILSTDLESIYFTSRKRLDLITVHFHTPGTQQLSLIGSIPSLILLTFFVFYTTFIVSSTCILICVQLFAPVLPFYPINYVNDCMNVVSAGRFISPEQVRPSPV